MRAAPAKKRIWSTAGGISSEAISALGLPVLRHSASMNRSASFSSASAMRNNARLRSDGVAERHPSKAALAAATASSTSAEPERGAEP